MKVKFKSIIIENEKKCKICARYLSKDGIIIMKNYICKDCIKDIVNIGVNDKTYDELIQKLKCIWNEVQ